MLIFHYNEHSGHCGGHHKDCFSSVLPDASILFTTASALQRPHAVANATALCPGQSLIPIAATYQAWARLPSVRTTSPVFTKVPTTPYPTPLTAHAACCLPSTPVPTTAAFRSTTHHGRTSVVPFTAFAWFFHLWRYLLPPLSPTTVAYFCVRCLLWACTRLTYSPFMPVVPPPTVSPTVALARAIHITRPATARGWRRRTSAYRAIQLSGHTDTFRTAVSSPVTFHTPGPFLRCTTTYLLLQRLAR